MQHTGFVLAGSIVALLATGWALRRFGAKWGSWVSVAGSMLARVVAGVIFALTAMRAAGRAGLGFIALAIVLGFLAFFDFAMLAVMAWGLAKFGPDPDKDEGREPRKVC